MKKVRKKGRYPKVPEIAEAFGVHERTVWEWVSKGILPHYRIGRSVFFKWSDIETHLGMNRYVGHELLPELYDPRANRSVTDEQLTIPFHDQHSLGELGDAAVSRRR